MTPAQRSLLALVITFLCAIPASAQVTGTPPFGSFAGGPDVIDLANLNAHITVPVINKPGRGIPFSYNITYDTSIWFPVGSSGSQFWSFVPGWGVQLLGTSGAGVSHSTTSTVCIVKWAPLPRGIRLRQLEVHGQVRDQPLVPWPDVHVHKSLRIWQHLTSGNRPGWFRILSLRHRQLGIRRDLGRNQPEFIASHRQEWKPDQRIGRRRIYRYAGNDGPLHDWIRHSGQSVPIQLHGTFGDQRLIQP